MIKDEDCIVYVRDDVTELEKMIALPNEQEIIDKILSMFKAKPIVQHKCHNCGGQLEMEIDNHLFKCPYCGSAYFVGTEMIHDKYL